MQLKKSLSFFILLLTVFLKAQNINELQRKLSLSAHPDSALKWCGLLSIKHKIKNLDSGLIYGKKAVTLIKKDSNPRYVGLAYMVLADAILYSSGDESSLFYYKQAEKSTLQAEDSMQLGYIYAGMGNYWLAKNNSVLSNSYYLKAIACLEKVNEHKMINKLKMCCANNYINNNEYEKGKAMCYQIMRKQKNSLDVDATAGLYVALGVSIRDSSILRSCYFHKQALRTYSLSSKGVNTGVNNIFRTNGLITACLNLAENYKDLYLETNNADYLKEGYAYLNKCREVYPYNKQDQNKASYYALLGKYHLINKKYDSCIFVSRKALLFNLTGIFHVSDYDIEAYNNLAAAFSSKNKHDSAYYNLKKAYDIATILGTDEIKKKMLDAETNYKIEKQDNEMKNILSEASLREKLQAERAHKSKIVFLTAISFLIILILLAMFIFKSYSQNQKLKLEKVEREKIAATLNGLKKQVSPHTMFNTLNNIYLSIEIDKESSKKMILLFAELLRYQLYECDTDKTALDKEIRHIKQYIELQKLRVSESCNVYVDIEEPGYNIKITPLLFITLIENGFKYVSNGCDGENFIKIRLSVKPNYISLKVQNTFYGLDEAVKSTNVGGLGIINLKQRLSVLYPDKHKLIIRTQKNVYTANLIINVA